MYWYRPIPKWHEQDWLPAATPTFITNIVDSYNLIKRNEGGDCQPRFGFRRNVGAKGDELRSISLRWVSLFEFKPRIVMLWNTAIKFVRHVPLPVAVHIGEVLL